MEPKRVREYVGPAGESVCSFWAGDGWQGEVRTGGAPGRVIGLVWQSGYHLTRWGAMRAVRQYLYHSGGRARLPYVGDGQGEP